MPDPRTVRVWDRFVRCFHWLLVLAFVTAYISTTGMPRWVHTGAGYVTLALVAARIVWGFTGSRAARFSNFVPTPRRLLRYLRAVLRGREPRYLGHNPAGAAMILALMAAVLGIGITGFLMTTDAFWGNETVEELHILFVDLTLAAVAIHVSANIYGSLHHRENLIWSMVTGRKAIELPGQALGEPPSTQFKPSLQSMFQESGFGSPPIDNRVPVWDRFVRAFHWLLVLGFAVAYLSTTGMPRWVHTSAGYVTLALVAARIVWGFKGGRAARFSNFVPTPRRLLRYLRAVLRRREPRYLGHNPAGAAMILALLCAVLGIGITGFLMTTDAFWGNETVEELHTLLVDLTLVAVAIHVCANIYGSLRHRENLIWSMVTGDKALELQNHHPVEATSTLFQVSLYPESTLPRRRL